MSHVQRTDLPWIQNSDRGDTPMDVARSRPHLKQRGAMSKPQAELIEEVSTVTPGGSEGDP